jgi:sugar phosphate isomerase/epimerase
MSYRFSLAYLTVFDLAPPEAVRVAAEAGYDMVGLRLLPSALEGPFPITSDSGLLRETCLAVQETGVGISDIEIIRIGMDFDLASKAAFLEVGQALGAQHILVAGDDPDEGRLTDNYAAFCELAKHYGMSADLEFMPWTAVKTAKDAERIIRKTQSDNAGLLIDALHFERSDTQLSDLKRIDPSMIHYVQMNDALAEYDASDEGLIYIAREERLNPGEGAIDLLGLLEVLPKDLVLSLEVPNKKRAMTQSPLERASAAIQAMKRVINKVGV